MREEQLVRRIEEQLLDQNLITFREIPFLHRRVDLVGFRDSDHYVIMVEAKIRNWRQAIDQARVCVLAANDVYIAIPEIVAHRVKESELRRFGIGLMVLNGSIEVRLPSNATPLNNKYQRRRLIDNLQMLSRSVQTHCEKGER